MTMQQRRMDSPQFPLPPPKKNITHSCGDFFSPVSKRSITCLSAFSTGGQNTGNCELGAENTLRSKVLSNYKEIIIQGTHNASLTSAQMKKSPPPHTPVFPLFDGQIENLVKVSAIPSNIAWTSVRKCPRENITTLPAVSLDFSPYCHWAFFLVRYSFLGGNGSIRWHEIRGKIAHH